MSDEKNLEQETTEEVTAPVAEETVVESAEETAPAKEESEETDGPEQVEIEIEDENSKLAQSPHDDFDWSIGNRHTLSF